MPATFPASERERLLQLLETQGAELLAARQARRAFAESVAAANPHLAVRILGRPLPKPPTVTAPIVLAGAPKKSGNIGRPPKYPWESMERGQFFDVGMDKVTRKGMASLAKQAWQRLRRRFGVVLAVDAAGRGVVRVTRIT